MLMKSILAAASAFALTALLASPVQADALTKPSTSQHGPVGALPSRGLSMAQVERRFGAPIDKLPAAGGDSPRHPTINRWRYSGYTVYFERNRVIHSVPDAVAVAIPHGSHE